jgi:hypothetical protein
MRGKRKFKIHVKFALFFQLFFGFFFFSSSLRLVGFYSHLQGLPLQTNGRLPPTAVGLPVAGRRLVGSERR